MIVTPSIAVISMFGRSPTETVARAIADHGIEAAQYQVTLKQVEALAAMGAGEGKQTVLVPAAALDAFSDAFKLLTGRGGAS